MDACLVWLTDDDALSPPLASAREAFFAKDLARTASRLVTAYGDSLDKLPDTSGASWICAALVRIQLASGQREAAAKILEDRRRLLEERHGQTPTEPALLRDRAYLVESEGRYILEGKRPDTARARFVRAFELLKRAGDQDTLQVGSVAHAIAEAHWQLEQDERSGDALSLARHATHTALGIADPRTLALTMHPGHRTWLAKSPKLTKHVDLELRAAAVTHMQVPAALAKAAEMYQKGLEALREGDGTLAPVALGAAVDELEEVCKEVDPEFASWYRYLAIAYFMATDTESELIAIRALARSKTLLSAMFRDVNQQRAEILESLGLSHLIDHPPDE